MKILFWLQKVLSIRFLQYADDDQGGSDLWDQDGSDLSDDSWSDESWNNGWSENWDSKEDSSSRGRVCNPGKQKK